MIAVWSQSHNLLLNAQMKPGELVVLVSAEAEAEEYISTSWRSG